VGRGLGDLGPKRGGSTEEVEPRRAWPSRMNQKVRPKGGAATEACPRGEVSGRLRTWKRADANTDCSKGDGDSKSLKRPVRVIMFHHLPVNTCVGYVFKKLQ
jgi:hypothetical protein